MNEGERSEAEGGKELKQRGEKHGAERIHSELQNRLYFEGLQENPFQLCYFLLGLLTMSLAVFSYKSTCGYSTAENRLPQSGSVSPGQLYKDKITSTGLLRKLC